MTPEGKVKKAVKELLKAHAAYYHMPVQNGMGVPTLDFVGWHRGRAFAVETKAGNSKPTKRQELTIAEMRKAGGQVFVINEREGMADLEWWLKGGCLRVNC